MLTFIPKIAFIKQTLKTCEIHIAQSHSRAATLYTLTLTPLTWYHRWLEDKGCCSQLRYLVSKPLCWSNTWSYILSWQRLKIACSCSQQQPLLPPLDIFGSFCDQVACTRMSGRGRMSIKSTGSPPTPRYSNKLGSSSTTVCALLPLHCVHKRFNLLFKCFIILF